MDILQDPIEDEEVKINSEKKLMKLLPRTG